MGMQFVLHSMLRLVLLQVQGCFGTLQKLENNGCLYCVLIFEENFFSSSQFQKARNHANCIQKQFSFKRSWSETYMKGILAQFLPTQTDEKLHFLSFFVSAHHAPQLEFTKQFWLGAYWQHLLILARNPAWQC